MVNRIAATIIADSLNKQKDRLTTFVLVFPRIVLAEFNTHRMISKNSASSRAIPFKTMLKKVQDEPFIPIAWQKEHKGMQGTDYFTNESTIDAAPGFLAPRSALATIKSAWLQARNEAVHQASALSEIGVTKQLCNRLLEPFLYHTVICTGTEWENFFALRAHPAAEIHIADLAEKMLVAYNESQPVFLKGGEYHIPFGDTLDKDRLYTMIEADHGVYDPVLIHNEMHGDNRNAELIAKYKVKIATARCARVSYLNFEGKDDYAADIKLHDTLAVMGHRSPFEHCGRAMTDEEYRNHINGEIKSFYPGIDVQGWSGNFKGFVQYRKLFADENKTDDRVLKHTS